MRTAVLKPSDPALRVRRQRGQDGVARDDRGSCGTRYWAERSYSRYGRRRLAAFRGTLKPLLGVQVMRPTGGPIPLALVGCRETMEPWAEEAIMRWSRGLGSRWVTTLVVLISLTGMAAGCAIVDSETSSEGTGPTVSSVPSSSTTIPVSSTSATTATTTTVAESIAIHLTGPTMGYSADGVYTIGGWTDRASTVAVGSVIVEANEDPVAGLAPFEVTVKLEPGAHRIEVTATDGTSSTNTTVAIDVIVDPAIEMPIAYIRTVDVDSRTITADYVEWLTGDEARDAALADGAIGSGEGLPGDFYIRNQNPAMRALPLADEATATLQVCYPNNGPCVSESTLSIEAWGELVDDPQSAEETHGWTWYSAHTSPYRIALHDGEVVHIAELYVP